MILGPVIIVSEKTQDGTDRTSGRCAVASEKGRNSDNGGVIFLIAAVVTSLFYVKDYPAIIPVLFLTLGFGIIGFLDDYLKVVLKRSDGLLPWQKFFSSGSSDCDFCILYR